MIPNNIFSSLSCELMDQKIDIQQILQRITPVQFTPNIMTFQGGPLLQNGVGITGPSLGTLTVQSSLQTLNLLAEEGYIHKLTVDHIDIGNAPSAFLTGPSGCSGMTGSTGIRGVIGTASIPGSTGPTGTNISQMPFDSLSPSYTTLSITDPSPTFIYSNSTFEAGTPVNGFSKLIINGYTGPDLLSPITNSVGSMFNNSICVMQSVGDTVYLGGSFTGSADGNIKYPYIAKWDADNGLQQVSGPTGPDKTVYCMAYDASKNVMYMGGRFSTWANITLNPKYVVAWDMGANTFSSLGASGAAPETGETGVIDSCCAMTMEESTGKLYVGWETGNKGRQLRKYQNGTWIGLTGPETFNIPKKILPDSANNVLYAGYDTWDQAAEPITMQQKIYAINETTGASSMVYSGDANSTVTMDNTHKLYIGIKQAANTASLPFGTSYMGTYTYGDSNISPFHEVATPINYLNYDKINNQLYICANTVNDTLSSIIDQKPYQSVVSYDGSSFKNVVDVDVFQFGLLEPSGNSQIILNPYYIDGFSSRYPISRYNTWPYVKQPTKTSGTTNQVYIYNCARVNQNASLSITAPVHYYNGNTGTQYTLPNIGDQVQMTWDAASSSWWV